MSAADGASLPGLAGPPGEPATALSPRPDRAVAADRRPSVVHAWYRFLASELSLIFLRIRNLAVLAVLAAVPLLIGLLLRFLATGSDNGQGPAAFFVNQIAGNGVFLALFALFIVMSLPVLPLAVAVVSGDSVAGEAGRGTLRCLLTVPAGRTRLLAVKYVAVVVFCVCASLLITGVAIAAGAILFPLGRVTLLSGDTIPLASGLLRVLLITLYVAAAMSALGAIGIAISTFTEHAIGAIVTTLIIVIASDVADQIPQIASAHPYLPTHWWLSIDAFLRDPVAWGDVRHGLISFAVYAAVFLAIAWARLSSADITS
jgi:ABC-type transport system involved in multi-copper enzyme maturation permease subunit